jgi:flagellar assembly protein FliH
VPKPPTAAEIDALRQAAHDEGRAAGHAEGLAAGQLEIQRRIAQLQGVLDGFTQPLARLDAEVTDALSDLAVRIAGVLVGRAYAADPTLLADLVREALDAVGSGSREIELRLHPDDYNVLAPHLSGLTGVRVTPDGNLARGELRLHSEGVRIDGTLAARLQSVLEATLAANAEDAG